MFGKKFKITYRPGLRMIISFVCILGILGGSVFSIYYAMRALYDSSLRDASTILFLDLESRSQHIAEGLPNFINALKRQEPMAEFLILDGRRIQWLRGDFASARSFSDLGIDYFAFDQNGDDSLLSFSSLNGQGFYATRGLDSGRGTIKLYEIENADLAKVFTLNTKYTVIYILNRAGNLVYTNMTDISPENVMKRPLVASFIKMPFRQGQSEFKINGDALYGFFQEIPHSNMVIFAEKTKSRAMQDVYATIRKVAAASIFYLALALLLLQVPLWSVTKPIRALTEMATRLANGDFEVNIKDQGFGELAVLSKSFVEMSQNLLKRDKLISALHIEKLEKTKMEQGIKVASTIQERFLFKPTIDADAGVKLAAKYEPSLHLAGDWYGAFYDPKRGETVISIVDITGHGIESAMMTPVMSVLFQEQMSRSEEKSFDIHEFLERCNSALYAYGAGISTATGIIAKFNKNDGSVTWYNAGHPAPVIVATDGSMVKAKGANSSGTILGFAPTIKISEQKMELEKGSVIALFSDGLMTAPVGGAIGFSRKDLFNILKNVQKNDVNAILTTVMETWRKKNEGVRIEDDMCIVLGVTA